MKTKIYVLCEPDGKIRYVGRTVNSLEKRLIAHLGESRRGKKTLRKMSLSHMGNKSNRGRHFTSEHCQNISRSIKRSPAAIAQRNKLHTSNYVHAKISASLMGNVPWNKGIKLKEFSHAN